MSPQINVARDSYVEYFIYGLENLVRDYPGHGKECFNEVVTASEITFTVDETGKHRYVGVDVKDGVLRILFGEANLGVNLSSVGENLPLAINQAPRASDLPLYVKESIKRDYDEQITPVKQAISELSGIPINELVLDPNFLENYNKLKEQPDDSYNSRDKQIGTVVLEYLKGLQYQMESAKFKGDELMQEGLQESIYAKTFKVRVVDKLEKGSGYNEVAIHDGVAYLQVRSDLFVLSRKDITSPFFFNRRLQTTGIRTFRTWEIISLKCWMVSRLYYLFLNKFLSIFLSRSLINRGI